MTAVEILEKITAERRAEKQALWKTISTKDPALKKLLEKVREKFGKPESVKVTWRNDE